MLCHLSIFTLRGTYSFRQHVVAIALAFVAVATSLPTAVAQTVPESATELPDPAESSAAINPVLEDDLAALRARIESLEMAREKPQEATSPLRDWVDVSNEKWTTKLGGQIMFDYVNWADESPAIAANAQDVASWRRIRFNYDATGYGIYNFRVQFDLDAKSDIGNGVLSPFV